MSLSFGQMHGISSIRNRFNWVEMVRWTALPERPWCEWGGLILKWLLQKLDVHWIKLFQDKVQWQAVFNMVMTFRFYRWQKFLETPRLLASQGLAPWRWWLSDSTKTEPLMQI